ncbi:cyclase family protein [Amycolatopsis sp. VC5-11]|uniref:cyclase family protein n=1 Tax=Amycolatopsis sp. VC5-11 TaxID=3120156 RepID=UPI003008E783
MPDARRIIDLSHAIVHDMVTNPWLQKPLISEFVTRDQSASFSETGVTFHMALFSMPGMTGTYLDSPFQFHAGGADVSSVPLEQLFDVPIAVIRIPAGIRPIGPEHFRPFEADLGGAAVLVHTGHSRHWGTGDFFRDSPYLTADAVDFLVSVRPRVVGIDSQNIDLGTDKTKPAQHRLLGADVVLLECMTGLAEVPDRGALLRVLPTPIRGAGCFPVRPVALVGA